MSGPRRLGVFGGTFDPPHVGHLVAALNVGHRLQLDRVLFVVANVPWQKVDDRSVSLAADRLAMTRLAVGERDGWELSTAEIDRGGDSVTADTLEELAGQLPGAELFVILGSDAAAGLGTWRRPEVVARLATVVVVDRPGHVRAQAPSWFRQLAVPCPLVDVSSRDLRGRVAAGDPIDYLVPEPVVRYIAERGLYLEDR